MSGEARRQLIFREALHRAPIRPDAPVEYLAGVAGDVAVELGVGPCLVAVVHDEHGVGRVEAQEQVARHGLVARRGLRLAQDVYEPLACPIVAVCEVEGVAARSAALLGEPRLALIVGGQVRERAWAQRDISEREALRALCGGACRHIGRIQVELSARERLAVLVDLLDLLVELGLQVEPERQRRVVVAALEVEELERVRGRRGERLPVPAHRPCRPCALELLTQARAYRRRRYVSSRLVEYLAVGVVGGAHAHLAGGEVDGAVYLGVDPSHIEHEHIIDEHPHIVIAHELEGHIPRAHLAAHRLAELAFHGEP